jgi:hypothetical protein
MNCKCKSVADLALPRIGQSGMMIGRSKKRRLWGA